MGNLGNPFFNSTVLLTSTEHPFNQVGLCAVDAVSENGSVRIYSQDNASVKRTGENGIFSFVDLHHDSNPYYLNTEYVHLNPNTIAVKAGQRVKRGQYLGDLHPSTGSHALHLHLQNVILTPSDEKTMDVRSPFTNWDESIRISVSSNPAYDVIRNSKWFKGGIFDYSRYKTYPVATKVKTTVNNVNLRADHSTKSASLGFLPSGTELVVNNHRVYYQKEGGWTWIAVSHGSKHGYVVTDYIKEVEIIEPPVDPEPPKDCVCDDLVLRIQELEDEAEEFRLYVDGKFSAISESSKVTKS